MFRIILLILIILISCKSKTHLDKKVKIQKGVYTLFNSVVLDNKDSFKFTYFDTNRNKVKEVNNLCIKSECQKTIANYDKAGNVIKEVVSVNGVETYRALMTYDSSNRLLSEEVIQNNEGYLDTVLIVHEIREAVDSTIIEIHIESSLVSRQIIKNIDGNEVISKYEGGSDGFILQSKLKLLKNVEGSDSLHILEYFEPNTQEVTRYWYDSVGNVLRNEKMINSRLVGAGENIYTNGILTKVVVKNWIDSQLVESEIQFEYEYW